MNRGLRALASFLLAGIGIAHPCEQPAAKDLGLELRRSWVTEDGLPQNSVRAVAQTPDGALWIGTFGGLARFDGRKFQCFTEGNTPELGSSFIRSLLVDRRGTLWIGSAEGSVASYADGHFRGFGRDQGVPDGVIAGLAEELDGSILVGGRDAIRRWNGTRFEDAAERTGEARLGVQHIHVAPDGTAWVAADLGLFRLAGRRLVLLETNDGNSGQPCSYVDSSPAFGVWARLGTGLALIDGDRIRLTTRDEARSTGYVSASVRLSTGRTIIAAWRGLFWLERTGDQLIPHPIELVGPKPVALFVDREDSLWIGHFSDGLAQVTHKSFSTLDFTDLGLARGNLLLATHGPDDIWVASNGGRTLVQLYDSGRVVTNDELSRGLGPVRGLLTTRDAVLWVHHDRGVRVSREGAIIDLACDIRSYTSPMVEDLTGNVWIGGSNALARVDAAGLVSRFTVEHGLPAEFVVSSLAVTPDAAVWAGTDDGLLRFANGAFERWTRGDGVPGGPIRALHAHGDALWLGSYGGGVARWRAHRIARVDASNGLLSDAISCLLGDDEGNLWVNSNRGAFRLTLADLENVANGSSKALACVAVRSPESGGIGGVRTRSGLVYFAGVDGLTRIDPTILSASSVAPGIELSSCVADGVSHDSRTAIEVAPGRRELVFTFNGLSLFEPGEVLYRFRLEGFDPSWRDGGREGVARYTSVPPGSYRFEVIARSYDGTWSTRPASMDLILEPYLHERAWFRIAVALLVVGLVAGAFFARSRAAERRQAALQREVERRTKAEDSLRSLAGELIRAQEEERRRVALELHDDLGQRLALLSVGLDVLVREHNSKQGGTANDMRAMADMVRTISSDVHEMSHRLHSTKLDKLGLRAALKLLCQEVSSRHEIAITFESKGDGTPAAQDVDLALYRIVQEALNNVIRHSDATTVRVEFESTNESIRLTVEDDGEGFDQEEAGNRSGLGLQGMNERMLLVGGTLTIRSKRGEGTRIEASVPIPSAGSQGSVLAGP